MTAIHESTFALKVAFVVCEFAIVFVLLDVLRCTGQGAHLVLAFAWNPLLAIEVAGSGHIDIVGALLLVVSAAALVRRWRTTAALALGLAVSVKFLPVVLLPLYWKRVRIRDAALAAAVVALLYVPFLNHGRIPIGSLGTYVQSFRFNGPVFAALDHVVPPQLLVALAVLVGLATATWLRRKAPEWSPAAFAWPMAASLLCAPAVFPWYLALAAAIPDVALNAADHHLDRQHHPHIRNVALAHTWTPVGFASWLGHAAGIRMRGNRRCDFRFAPAYTAGVGPTHNFCIRKSGRLIQRSVCSIHRGGTSMRNSGRLHVIRLLAFNLLFILPATLLAQQRAPILDQIAKTYGIDSWDKVEAIRYTWNGEITGLFKASRAWTWEPKTNKVTFEGKDQDGKPVNVTYLRSELSSQPDAVKKVDSGFINDNYWLLFPFHAYWDTSATVTDQGMQKLPMGTGSAELVSVKYPSEAGGYTPGDTWNLYVGKDNRVKVLEFHHGGNAKPSLVIATWTGYKKAGPLLFSTEHRGTADGKALHIFMTNVAVKLVGSDKWMPAQ